MTFFGCSVLILLLVTTVSNASDSGRENSEGRGILETGQIGERDRGDEKMIKDWKSIRKREEKRHNVNYRVGISESLDLFRDNT